MASPPILSMSDVCLSFGGNPLFEGVGFVLSKGERAALVGRNGAGKSTLIQLISGHFEPDTGQIWCQPGADITAIEQEPDLSRFSTALEFCTAGRATAWDAEAEMGQFGVDPNADPKTLSGGQIRRVALARAFAEMPDILLLDEPTNHLDVPMIEALEQRLETFPGAVLLVSHDRRFLETVTTNTLWLRGGEVLKSPKGYAFFDEWAEEIEQADRKQISKIKTQLKAEHHWLARGVTGRRKRNMGRLSRLHEMRADFARKQGAMNTANATAGLSAQAGDNQSRKVLEAFGLSLAYGPFKIVENLDLRVLRGDRIGIIGANGVGKTTLIRLLLGEIASDDGHVKVNPSLDVTYLDQIRQLLQPGDTLREALTPNGGDSISVQGQPRHVVAYAKDFLFGTEQLNQPVSALSGGERNRLTLAIALAQATDVLVLDEPTNDLDMQTLELLEDMLLNFSGTLILVSHDRSFLDASVTSCLVPVGNGQWLRTAGGWSDAQKQIRAETKKISKSKAKSKPGTPQKKSVQHPTTKLSFKDQHRLREVETEIPTLEGQIAKLETELSQPNLYQQQPEAFARLSRELEQAQAELLQAEEDWLSIEAKKEALDK
ncbi:MAG: elongation factor 3 [Hyphomonadaceae bacterium]|nr:elongation factor 3 [Hyphomonadaceae bacterium]OUX94325.1 MAG: elongation factor 3 [Hyphomonas sp. TMED17]